MPHQLFQCWGHNKDCMFVNSQGPDQAARKLLVYDIILVYIGLDKNFFT